MFILQLLLPDSQRISQHRTELGLNQACTLFGATSGSDIIAGHSYIEAGYGLYVSDLWKRNLLVTIGFMFLFQLTQMLALEYFPVRVHSLWKPIHLIFLDCSNMLSTIRSAYLPKRTRIRDIVTKPFV